MFLKIFRFHKHLGAVALQATTWVLMLVGAAQERKKEKGKGRGTGQAYAATAEEECDHSGRGVIDGMVLISRSWAHALFDTGASHSFISLLFANTLGLGFENLNMPLSLKTPLGKAHDLTVCLIWINLWWCLLMTFWFIPELVKNM
ncbi:hypothetical protein ACOSQ3_013542 [Xanthoceras sorbifolium]